MSLTFLFTPAQLPVTTLHILWKRLPFFIAFICNVSWLGNAVFISIIYDVPLGVGALASTKNYGFIIAIMLLILILGMAFLHGKMYKRSKHIPRKKTLHLIIIHVAVLIPVYLVGLLVSGSNKIAALIILFLTLYVGMSRFMIAKNVLFIIQLFDGQNTFYY